MDGGSLESSLEHLHHIWFMFHLLHLLLKFSVTLLEALSKGGLTLALIFIEVSLFQFSILVLKILDFLFHHLDGDVFGL